MPSTPYAKVLVSVNAGGPQFGGLEIPSAATIQLYGENIAGWLRARWEIVDYPEGFTAPTGWTTGADGTIYSLDITPIAFTLPANNFVWGKYAIRLIVNEQIDTDTTVLADGQLYDDQTILSVLSPLGLRDVSALEKSQFTTTTTRIKGWLRDIQRDLRVLSTLATGGGNVTLNAPGGAARAVQWNNTTTFGGAAHVSVSSDGALEVAADRVGGPALVGDLRFAKNGSAYARSAAGSKNISIFNHAAGATSTEVLNFGWDGTGTLVDTNGTGADQTQGFAKQVLSLQAGLVGGVYAAGLITIAPNVLKTGSGATARGVLAHPNFGLGRAALWNGLDHDPWGGGLGVGIVEDQVTEPTGNPVGAYWYRSNPFNHHPEIKLPTGDWVDLLAVSTSSGLYGQIATINPDGNGLIDVASVDEPGNAVATVVIGVDAAVVKSVNGQNALPGRRIILLFKFGGTIPGQTLTSDLQIQTPIGEDVNIGPGGSVMIYRSENNTSGPSCWGILRNRVDLSSADVVNLLPIDNGGTGLGLSSLVGKAGKVMVVGTGENTFTFAALPSGSTVPTGTGFRHVTSGAEDAASKLVADADVATNAAIAISKIAAPSGTGVATVASGTFGTPIAPGTTGNVLTSNGTAWTSSPPTSGGSGATSITNDGSGATIGNSITSGALHLATIEVTAPVAATKNSDGSVGLAITPSGTNGYVLSTVGGVVVWAAAPSGGGGSAYTAADGGGNGYPTYYQTVGNQFQFRSIAVSSPLGIYEEGATLAIQINGGSNGQVLTTDSSGNVGWATPSSSSGIQTLAVSSPLGRYGSATNATVQINPGSAGQYLGTDSSGNVNWVTPPSGSGGGTYTAGSTGGSGVSIYYGTSGTEFEFKTIAASAPLAVYDESTYLAIQINPGSNGQVLTTTSGSVGWATPSSGSGSAPGGSTGQYQYNNGTALAGAAVSEDSTAIYINKPRLGGATYPFSSEGCCPISTSASTYTLGPSEWKFTAISFGNAIGSSGLAVTFPNPSDETHAYFKWVYVSTFGGGDQFGSKSTYLQVKCGTASVNLAEMGWHYLLFRANYVQELVGPPSLANYAVSGSAPFYLGETTAGVHKFATLKAGANINLAYNGDGSYTINYYSGVGSTTPAGNTTHAT